MKKLMIYVFAIAMALVSPFLVGTVFDENSPVVEAQGVDNLGQIVSLDGEYELRDDITINTPTTLAPIGTEDKPFTGIFDGQGHTIELTSECLFAQTKYQGIFGYAKDATIRNVKIICEYQGFNLGFSGTIDEYYVGILLGLGENVTIENCEVEGKVSSYEDMIQSKVTYGGMVGCLKGQSTIVNCSSDVEAYMQYALESNTYTIKTGGMVGELVDSATMKYCVSYGSSSSYNNKTSVNATIYQGGLIGNINGELVKVYNTVTVYTFDSQFMDSKDVIYTGAIVGAITQLKEGNISSSGYNSILNGTQILNFYGNASEVQYNFKDNNEKDDVLSINSGLASVENFYTTDNYSDCGLDWYDLDEFFDFKSNWIIVNEVAKLQQFQYFEIKLTDPLDAIYNTLIDLNADDKVESSYAYGNYAEFTIGFSNVEEYQGYYEINDILQDGVSVGFADFLPEEQQADEGSYKVTKRESVDGKYELYTKVDEANNKKQFVFKVKAEYSTKGTYSFRTSEIPYFAYILAEEGGEVKSASSSVSKTELEPRQLTKNYEWNIKAIPAYQYAFSSWTLWEEISAETYEANKDSADYFKYTVVDAITQKDKHTYWHLAQGKLEGKTEILSAMKSADYKITFGSDPYYSNFMLKATFEKKIYYFNIKDIDVNKVNQIEVVNKLGQTTIFNENSTNTDFVELDQNENITLNVYLKPGYTIDPENLPEELKAEYLGKSEYSLNGQISNVLKFTIATSSFKDLVNQNQQLSLELIIDESDENANGGMPLWVILTIAGGGALLIAVIIIIIVVKVRRGGGRTPKNKGGKSAQALSDYDFDKMFK